MTSLLNTSLSGLKAAQARLDTAGHNIANLDTPEFRRQEVKSSTTAMGSVQVWLSTASKVGPAPEADLVGLVQARKDFGASAAVLRAAERDARTLGSLVDTSA